MLQPVVKQAINKISAHNTGMLKNLNMTIPSNRGPDGIRDATSESPDSLLHAQSRSFHRLNIFVLVQLDCVQWTVEDPKIKKVVV